VRKQGKRGRWGRREVESNRTNNQKILKSKQASQSNEIKQSIKQTPGNQAAINQSIKNTQNKQQQQQQQ
jgi:hypothetical protein